jgi:hypothetical protein
MMKKELDMSDNANLILQEQVSDELLNMSLSKFFALLDEREHNGDYDRLCLIFSEIVDTIVEERSE